MWRKLMLSIIPYMFAISFFYYTLCAYPKTEEQRKQDDEDQIEYLKQWYIEHNK